MLTTTEIIIRMAVALVLCSIVGLERTLAGKRAGMRTYAMIGVGSALFIIISELIIASSPYPSSSSPLSMASAIISSIGFIGAGLVVFQLPDHKVTGLTTAASFWVSAGIGISSGFGLFKLAIIGTVATLIVFTIFWFFENNLKRFSYKNGDSDKME